MRVFARALVEGLVFMVSGGGMVVAMAVLVSKHRDETWKRELEE